MAEVVIADGLLDFSGGVNSLVPTTVASPQAPNGLKRNQLAWLVNGTVRGTGITSRTGWQYLCTVHDGSLIYQGGFMYRPLSADPYLVISIGGRVYQVRIDLSAPTITDIMAAGDTNPINEPEAFFVQGEEFLIIQAGDNSTLPLFWDGINLRRSLGPSQNLGLTAANFVVPAVGSPVQVTLSSPYLGPIDQVVLINGKQYQVISGNSLQKAVTLTNRGDLPAGRNWPATYTLIALTKDVSATSTSAVTYDGTYWNVNVTNFPAFPIGNTGNGFFNGVGVTFRQISNTLIKMFNLSYGSPQSTQVLTAPIGTEVFSVAHKTAVGSLKTGFATPGINSTVQTVIDADYAGPFGVPAVIGFPGTTNGLSGLYEITSVGYPPLPPNDVLLVNLNDTPTNVVASPTSLTTEAELPAATSMDYYMGRIWYAQGRTYIAGDIVRGPSGTLPYGFRDSLLKVTENPLAIGGDGFTIPAEAGNIRALKHTAELDTTLGQGKLYIFSSKSIYRLDVPVSRQSWIAASDATQPMQVVVQLNYGSVGDRCVVPVNSDLFYQTFVPDIRSLALSQRQFQQGSWGNVPISRNENRVLRFNDRSLLRFASGIEFDNRLWQTAVPVQTQVGVAFQAVVPLDYDLISTLEEKEPPAWEGIYEGLDILQLFEGDFGGRHRAFAVVHSRDDHSIQVWELTDFLRTDMNIQGEARTVWSIEFPALTWDQVFLLKKLIGGELWVDRVYGTVMFKLEYRPDGDNCWYFWDQWQICSARNSCEDLVNPICYPIGQYSENFKQTVSFPRPPAVCQSMSGRPTDLAYQFQTKLTITGWCRVRGLLLYANQVEKSIYRDIVCPGITPVAAIVPGPAGVIPPTLAAQQVVDSSAPTVFTPSITTQIFPIGTIVDNSVDPVVCTFGGCENVNLQAEALLGGNAFLKWNQPIGFGIVEVLFLQRSTDNINWDNIAQYNTPTQGANVGDFTYTDPDVPTLTFFYRIQGFTITGENYLYNTVSITRPFNLRIAASGAGNTLTWDAPVF